LTIKLTQHVGLRQTRFEPCLKPSTKCPRGSLPSKRVQRQVRLSTIRYSRAKICSLLRYANLDIRATQCQLPSVVKEQCPDHQFPIGTSPLPAERGIGLEPMPRKIKNPASSAGRFRPFAGSLGRSDLWDGCARCSIVSTRYS